MAQSSLLPQPVVTADLTVSILLISFFMYTFLNSRRMAQSSLLPQPVVTAVSIVPIFMFAPFHLSSLLTSDASAPEQSLSNNQQLDFTAHKKQSTNQFEPAFNAAWSNKPTQFVTS